MHGVCLFLAVSMLGSAPKKNTHSTGGPLNHVLSQAAKHSKKKIEIGSSTFLVNLEDIPKNPILKLLYDHPTTTYQILRPSQIESIDLTSWHHDQVVNDALNLIASRGGLKGSFDDRVLLISSAHSKAVRNAARKFNWPFPRACDWSSCTLRSLGTMLGERTESAHTRNIHWSGRYIDEKTGKVMVYDPTAKQFKIDPLSILGLDLHVFNEWVNDNSSLAPWMTTKLQKDFEAAMRRPKDERTAAVIRKHTPPVQKRFIETAESSKKKVESNNPVWNWIDKLVGVVSSQKEQLEAPPVVSH